MPYSTQAKNLMLQAIADTAAWVTLHTATTLDSGAGAGQGQVAVVNAVEVGATIKIDPGEANEETHSVIAVDGTGPFTLTLAGNLANTHDVGVYVSYDPHTGIGPVEPTGGAPTFERKPIAWNVPALGVLDSSNMPEFDVAPSIPITHVVVMDEFASSTVFAWDEIPLTIYDAQSVFRLRDADLHLNG